MLILVDNEQLSNLVGVAYQLVQPYPAFCLLDYLGAPEDLAAIPHQVTEDLPIQVNGRAVTVPRGQFESTGHPRTLLRFAGPIGREWKRKLLATGAKLYFWCPPFGACVQLPAGFHAQALQSLPGVIGAVPYRAPNCSRPLSTPSIHVAHQAGLPEHWVDLVCFSEHDRDRVQDQLRDAGATIVATSKYKLRVAYEQSLETLRAMHGVKLADQTRPTLAAGHTLQEAMGVPGSHPALVDLALDGEGQVVAVADTGLDRGESEGELHPDFAGRVRSITSWPIDPSWTPYVTQPGHDDGAADVNSGHGTHVAGLAVGNGAASQGKYRGLAPGASLVFQAIEQFTSVSRAHRDEIASGFYLSGRPLDLHALFAEARELGARIHVNAWGDPARGAYTDDCYESDDFLFKNADALVLFAAGNEGSDRDGNRRIDAGSLFAPAAAKNVIAIGATEGPRQGVGLRVNWGGFNRPGQRRFAHRADRNDAISGEPDHMALISSAGPTRDGRIKPDLCAPGTNLAAPRSQAADVRGWGLASPMPYYMYFGGTSMATGAAGGYFALLRQSWQQHNAGVAPSGAALKALAILAAKPVLQRDGSGMEARSVAGFGSIDLGAALPDAQNPIRLVDHREPGLASGDRLEYTIRLNQETPFKAALCWYDAPGEALINDLDLCLLDEDGVRHWGNHPEGQTGSADRVNNVEVIDASILPAGTYRLQVTAVNVPVGPQTFALAFRAPMVEILPLPLNWIHGIGRTYERRLKEQGITHLAPLLELSLEQLQDILQRRGKGIQRLYIKLLLLKERMQWAPPPALPADLGLAQLGEPAPEAIPAALWHRTRQHLLPLLSVFDQGKLKRIQLRHLFHLQS